MMMNGWWRHCRVTSCAALSTPATLRAENQLYTCRRPEVASCSSCGCRTALRRCRAPSRSIHWRSGTGGWSAPSLSWQRWWSQRASCWSASASPWLSTSTSSVRQTATSLVGRQRNTNGSAISLLGRIAWTHCIDAAYCYRCLCLAHGCAVQKHG